MMIKQPALAPSPQSRPAPTVRALPPELAVQRGPFWMPIRGPNPTPIDILAFRQWNTPVLVSGESTRNRRLFSGLNCFGATGGRSMPNFGFHIRHGNHSSDHNVDLPDMRAAHNEATMIFGDMARDVAAQLYETPEWRMDVSDESGKSLFRLRLLTEPLE